MKGILISSEQIEWFIDMLCNSYDKDDVKDRILGALEMVLSQEQENYRFDFVTTDTEPNKEWRPIYAEEIAHKKVDRLHQ